MADTSSINESTLLEFENNFARVPASFFTKLLPTPLPTPYLIAISEPMMATLGMDMAMATESPFKEIFTGNQLGKNSSPLASIYSGHQFGVWAGQLGDGRAILLGDVASKSSENRLEIQLKGAGATPYSRMGDGRAVLRSSIREFLCSEAMAGLNIPTSRALCLTGSDQYVMREQPETTAVLTRTAPSFIRFGSFEHWHYTNQVEQLQTLADFVIANYFPELQSSNNPYQSLLAEVTKRTAELMAHWQAVGFMHGVMNTDNMSILGLTLDYGPFGFMDAIDPQHICNHTDTQGRYAYSMQPEIGLWNCHALGQAMLPLIGDVEDTKQALSGYQNYYEEKLSALMHQKFGMQKVDESDQQLFDDFFKLMHENHADFTLSFRQLGEVLKNNDHQDGKIRQLFIHRTALNRWLQRYKLRLQQETSTDDERRQAMHAVNPKYVLRNYLAQIAIEKAQNKDFSEVNKLLKILAHPFDEQPEHHTYSALPPDWANKLEVSCSS